MSKAKPKETPVAGPVAAAVSEAIAAQPKVVLTAEEINAIADIVATAPCPGGIPQAQARSNLIQKFIASVK